MDYRNITVDDLEHRHELPCGCIHGIYKDAFVIQPCAPTCIYYKYTLEEQARQGKPIEFSTDYE